MHAMHYVHGNSQIQYPNSANNLDPTRVLAFNA